MALTTLTALQNYQGQFSQNIIGNLYDGLTIQNDAYVINNLNAKRNLWTYEAADGMRPIDTTVEDTDENQGGFKLRSIEPSVFMKLLKVIPEEFRDTFMSEQLSPNAKEYPMGFPQYFFEQHSKRGAREINQNAYKGVDPDSVAAWASGSTYAVGALVYFVKPITGRNFFRCTAITTAGQSPVTHPEKWANANNQCLAKGWGTIIAEEIAASNLAPISLGSLTDSNAFTKIDNDFYFSIPEEVRNGADKIEILMSADNYEKRRKALIAAYPNAPEIMAKEGNTTGNIWGSDGMAVAKKCTWLRGSNRIIANIHSEGKKNLVMGVDRLPASPSFGPIVPLLHGYKTILKGILAFQIADLRYLYVNELA